MLSGDPICGAPISDTSTALLAIQADSVFNIEYFPEYIVVTKWKFGERPQTLILDNRVYKIVLPSRDIVYSYDGRPLEW